MSSSADPIVIVGAARTPMGGLLGDLGAQAKRPRSATEGHDRARRRMRARMIPKAPGFNADPTPAHKRQIPGHSW